jgi:hypothetical protein
MHQDTQNILQLIVFEVWFFLTINMYGIRRIPTTYIYTVGGMARELNGDDGTASDCRFHRL